ncbi:MAG: hypothetical protein JSR91_04270 [Proteobacteria bacterium]|nr:hypothetical protein [Pseudomonadota bacterium]
MKTLIAVATVASICLPFAAFADDGAYCSQLAQTYRRAVGSSPSTGGPVPVALEGCKTDPAKSIPVLEKALQERKVTLPKRD